MISADVSGSSGWAPQGAIAPGWCAFFLRKGDPTPGMAIAAVIGRLSASSRRLIRDGGGRLPMETDT